MTYFKLYHHVRCIFHGIKKTIQFLAVSLIFFKFIIGS